MAKKFALNELKENRFRSQKLEIEIYNHIGVMFKNQLCEPTETGEENGISDEDILEEVLGKKKYTQKEIDLIKKCRMRFQQGVKCLVGSYNSSGEYRRYYPKTIEEEDRYINTRKSVCVGLTKGFIRNLKNNAERLGYDWKEKASEAVSYLTRDVKAYIAIGNGDATKIDFKESLKKIKKE